MSPRAIVRVGSRLVGALALFVLLWLVVVFIQVRNAGMGAQSIETSGEAIVILGAAQYNGEPSPVLQRRLDTALELWESGVAPKVVTTGANQPGDAFTEGFAGFRYLRNAGIGEDQLVVVVDGGDTYESLLAAANQLDSTERDVVVVTDAYHARRAAETAREVGLEPTVVAAGDDMGFRRLLRETVAVSAGRLFSYRRLSDWR